MSEREQLIRAATVQFGPQGAEVVAIVVRAERITSDEGMQFAAFYDAQDAAFGAAQDAALYAAWRAAFYDDRVAVYYAVQDAAFYAVQDAVPDFAPWRARAAFDGARAAVFAAVYAVVGWVCKDIITAEQFQVLTAPWYAVIKDDVSA